MLAHSCSRTPRITDGEGWFGATCSSISTMWPLMACLASLPGAPHTTTLMRASLIAYAHMMHGSTLVYSVQPVRSRERRRSKAVRSASISACAVASWRARTASTPSDTMSSPYTTNDPTGESPCSSACRASSIHRRMWRSCCGVLLMKEGSSNLSIDLGGIPQGRAKG